MTPREFFEKVVRMRSLQLRSLGKNSPFTSKECQATEAEIDREIARVRKEMAAKEREASPTLFQ